MPNIITRGEFQNNINSLPDLEDEDFENIFKLCVDNNKGVYFYNILKTVNIPTNIEKSMISVHKVNANTPLTALSNTHYGTIKLWWLICAVNNIRHRVKFIKPGRAIKIIKPQYVRYVISLIKQSLVD